MRASLPTPLVVTALLSTLAGASVIGACGKLKPAEGADGGAGAAGATSSAAGAGGSTGKVIVTISGIAAPHPLNAALDATADFSMLKVAIVDPSAVLLDPTATPLGSATLDTSMTNCDTMFDCAWSLSGIDITNQNLGLVGTLEDTRTGAARLWVKTGTGMGSAADVKAVIMSPAPITGRRAFIVSRKLEGVLAAFASKALNTTFNPGDLETRGFLIGHVVGAVVGDAVPAAVAGATVSTTADGLDVIYPNADFSGTGTSTGPDGLFLMIPRLTPSGPQSVVAAWTVTPPATDTRTWNQYLAGSNPGNAFIIIMAAN
jgi:hypothetical protein